MIHTWHNTSLVILDMLYSSIESTIASFKGVGSKSINDVMMTTFSIGLEALICLHGKQQYM